MKLLDIDQILLFHAKRKDLKVDAVTLLRLLSKESLLHKRVKMCQQSKNPNK